MMNINKKMRPKTYNLILAGTFLLFSGIACTFDFNTSENTPDETEISKSVEETLTAEQALTVEALQTEKSAPLQATETEAMSVQQTIQAQQATLDVQSTQISDPNLTTTLSEEVAPPSVEAPVSFDPIPLGDWKLINMVQAPGCGEDRNGPPCWFGSAETLSITSLKPILIDPSWPSPYLVFSHRYVFIHNATIYVNVGGGWEILWTFPAGQSTPWLPFQVELSKFSGKEILIQLHATGTSISPSGKTRVSAWDVRDPQIIPNHSPY
jgi:hypothetical protein